MNAKEFNSIKENIEKNTARKVTFKYINVMNGKEEIHAGTIQGVYGDCLVLVNETLNWRSLAHYTDVYLA